jgi:hypothetical protein
MPVVRLTRATDCHARRAGANQWSELVDGSLDHFVSTPLIYALSVASSSNSAEHFPWTSITLRARTRSPSSRFTW